ncbi:MAG: tetratricopeptide repeat protein [Deltaproteobacteria bacterium]|nr:tetratricopeptide repeat protein [Deltaproteobacteria bacterium]
MRVRRPEMISPWHRCVAMAIAACWLAHSLPCHAETKVDAAGRAKARSYFEQGAEHYRQGRYDDAIKAFQAAYDIEPAGALLLNIAQANRLRVPPHCASALRHYELYLAAEPRAAERAEVESYIKAMRACVEQERQTMAPEPAPEAAHPRAPKPRSHIPLWAAGAGAVVFLGGAGLYTRARLRFNELKNECPCPDDTIDGWQAATNVSYAMMAAGSVTVAAALAVWWWPAGAEGERSTFAAVLLPEQGLHLQWRGHF